MAEAYVPIKWHLDPSSSLATTDMGRKLGAVPHWGREELGPHVTQCRLAKASCLPSSILIHPAILATTDISRKLGAVPPFWGELGPH